MKNIDTKNLETERLLIKIPTMKEQKDLWNIVKKSEINKYYFPTPDRIFNKNNLNKDNIDDLIKARKIFEEQLNDWERQEPFYEKKIVDIQNGENNQKFTWSIFIKNGNIIGQMTVQPSEYDDPDVRDVGWFIDTKYQGKGYGKEAAKKVLDYMFKEVEIKKIITSAAAINPASWKIMEGLGFNYIGNKKSTYFDENNNILECRCYSITREEYLSFNNKI